MNVINTLHPFQVKKKKKEGRPARPLKQRIEEITFDYEKIKKLGGYGLIQSEIANVLGVSPKTLSVWKKNSEFRSILKKGKDEADAAVIASAFDKTQWKEYWEETIEYSEGKDKDGKPRVKSIRRTKIKKGSFIPFYFKIITGSH